MAAINIENAQINTASIEVKTLTIKGRQLTLSVFRQIPYKELVDMNTRTLIGNPWGVVNYFFKDNKNYDPNKYWHIVWQEEKTLNRCIIPKDVHKNKYINQIKENIKHNNNLLCSFTDKNKNTGYYGMYDESEFLSNNIPMIEERIEYLKEKINNIENGRLRITSEESQLNDLQEYKNRSSYCYNEKKYDDLISKKQNNTLQTLQMAIHQAIKEINSELNIKYNELKDRKERMAQLIDEIREDQIYLHKVCAQAERLNKLFHDLPQFYIAV